MKVIFIIMALFFIGGCGDPRLLTQRSINNAKQICKKEFNMDFVGVDWFRIGVETYQITCISKKDAFKEVIVSYEEFKAGGKVEEGK